MKKSLVFGGKCIELLANLDQGSLSWKTCQMCFEWVEQKSLDRLPQSGMILNGALYRLESLERHTSESVGFVLPTPNAVQHQTKKKRQRAIEQAKAGQPLKARYRVNGEYDPGNRQFSIMDTLIYQMILPTPTTSDHKNTPFSPSRHSGNHQKCLNTVLGQTYLEQTDQTLEEVIGKKIRIHPHFVLWMMGFPIDWLD